MFQSAFIVHGGGWNAVVAEMKLLELALNSGSYDRIVFLQGADYPLKTDIEIYNFFLKKQEDRVC